MASRTRQHKSLSLSRAVWGVAVAAASTGLLVPAAVAYVTGVAAAPLLAVYACTLALTLFILLAGLSVVFHRVSDGSETLVEAMEKFAAGDMAARAEDPGIAELDGVTRSFNQMAGRVSQATKRLAHEAFHDPLTGLPNRTYFMSRLRAALVESKHGRNRVAVLCIDLDRFKNINDTLGHGVGDELLSVIAVRLGSVVGKEHMVARLGGDEFTVLLEQTGEAETQRMAQRVTDALRRSFHVSGHELFVTASVGVALAGPGTGNSNDLLRHADIALYRAKEGGASQFVLFGPEMDRHSPDHLELEADLRRAVERGELVLHYQPQVSLATGDLVGMEALVRWRHRDRGLISPATFIPLAEETGEIAKIGQWVLERACWDTTELLKMFPDLPLRVGVNVSAREFLRGDLVGRVSTVLRETGLPPDLLELEITESAVIDKLDQAVATLGLLRQLGVKLAIDDFGTGYSSLSYLHRLPLTTLKMDRSFVKDVGGAKTPSAVARAIVDVASALGMEVVAEGIETTEQLNYLRLLRCGRGQGFLFSKPMPAGEFARLLAARARKQLKAS